MIIWCIIGVCVIAHKYITHNHFLTPLCILLMFPLLIIGGLLILLYECYHTIKDIVQNS